MTASNQIFLAMDEGRSVTAFTSKRELIGFLRSRFWLVGNPLIYKFAGNGYAPVIMTMSSTLAEG
jgi:hypothetical protein